MNKDFRAQHPLNVFIVVKLTIFLITVFSLQVTAGAMAQKIALKANNQSLVSVLHELRKQSGYAFLYNEKDLVQAMPVTIHVKNKDLTDVLPLLFEGQPLTYSIKGRVISVILKSLPPETSPRGEPEANLVLAYPEVRGRVVDTLGQPLVGASVRVLNAEGKRTTLQTKTDQAGYFVLENVPEDAQLEFSFVGRISRTVVAQADVGTIVLKLALSDLEEVEVSTGYQTIPKERATGSFVHIDNELLNRRISTNILDRLEGITPSLLFNKNTVRSNNGNHDISIRGTNTLRADSEPLIVVDGFPYDGNLLNINPNTVESITVLKDAAASSIWGVKSGNGVIVIETKQGSRNQPLKLEFNANLTLGQQPDLLYNPNFLDAKGFIEVESALFSRGYYDTDLNDGLTVVSPVVAMLAGNVGTAQFAKLEGLDIRNDLSKYFYRHSVNQQYSLTMSGGGNKSDYFFSTGYDDNRSNQIGNNLQRVNLNALYNYYPIDGLKIAVGLNYIITNSANNSPLIDIHGGPQKPRLYPYARLADDEGNALAVDRDYSDTYKSTLNQELFRDWTFRPIDELRISDNAQRRAESRININLNYVIGSGISVNAKYLFQNQVENSENYHAASSYYTRDLINRFIQPEAANPFVVPRGGILQLGNSDISSHRARIQANYESMFSDDHEVNGILGAEINHAQTNAYYNTIYGYNKQTTTYENVNLNTIYPVNPRGSSFIPTTQSIGAFIDRYISHFGNLSYSYKRRYTLSASGRIDRSNLFGVNTNQKAVPLYSAGFAWVFSKESFYRSHILPYGQLRMTYGYNGNVNKAATAVTTIRQLDGITNMYSGAVSSVIANPGNPELRWEKVRMINFGFDFRSRNNVLSGSLEYYIKKGVDIFGPKLLPTSTGLANITANAANIKGQGMDLMLTTKNVDRNRFAWSTDWLLSYVQDIVVDYHLQQRSNARQFLNGSTSIQPIAGKPMYAIYAFPWAGLNAETGDPQGYLDGEISTDYTGIINATTVDSLKYIGPSRPTTFGAIRNTIRYGNLSFSFNAVYKLNYHFLRSSISNALPIYAWGGHKDYYKRWQKPGDENTTTVPSFEYPPFNSNRQTFYSSSEILVEKGDHFRLQDIQLSYRFDGEIWSKLNIKQLQLYAYVNNVGILWRANREGLDPDISQTSATNFPAPRTFAIGLKANL